MSQSCPQPSLLDRPLFSRRMAGSRAITWETLFIVALVVLVVATRLWDLGSRGFEHDESIHGWESWKLVTGQGYVHDPAYHGPFLYHLIALVFLLFGDSDYTARLGPALFGIALVFIPWALRKWLGRKGALMSMLLMAVSPVVMCRSRFVWHDPPASVFNLLLFVFIVRYLDQRKDRDLYLATLALALGVCTKATSYITVALFAAFLVVAFLWQWLRDRHRPSRDVPAYDLVLLFTTLMLPLASPFAIKLLGHDPVAYDTGAILFSGGVFVVVLAASVGLGLWWDRRRWPRCAAVFWGLYVLLYTCFFTNPQGFGTGTVGMLGYWLAQQGVRRGNQPWFYYLVLLALYEFLPVIGSMGALILYALKGDPRTRRGRVQREREEAQAVAGRAAELALNAAPAEAPDVAAPSVTPVRAAIRSVPFVPLLIYWSVSTLLIYSWAGEKMPWLTLHVVLPLHLLAGWGLGRLLEADWRAILACKGLWLAVALPLLVCALVWTVLARPADGVTSDVGSLLDWLAALTVLGLLVALATVVWRRIGGRNALRVVCLSLVGVLLALTVRFAWMATFINADYATEFLVYAAGTPDTALVTRELEQLSERAKGDLSLKLAYDNEAWWPFCWYLRHFSNATTYVDKPVQPLSPDALIVNHKSEEATKPYLNLADYNRRQYRMLWWPNEDWYRPLTLKALWADLRDPVARRALWNVVFYRVHGQPTTAWYNGTSFALYLRKDLAARLWGLQ